MEKTLVVMAAGIGSRFGGLKQIEPIGPNKEFIIDYSVYDAIRVGFKKVVFIIKKDLEEVFKETIGNRLEDKIEIEYVFQEKDSMLGKYKYLAKKREKPWGTVHALLCAKSCVSQNFAVINADDFYGYDAFKKLSSFLDNNKDSNTYITINFPFIVTSSLNGSVKRAVCFSENNIVTKLIESKLTIKKDYVLCEPLNGDKSFKIDINTPVAVNMFGFKTSIFKYLEEYLRNYFKQEEDVILNNEMLLPELIKEKIDEKEIKLMSALSDSNYIGMTYKEDLKLLKEKINELIEKGEYPRELWR